MLDSVTILRQSSVSHSKYSVLQSGAAIVSIDHTYRYRIHPVECTLIVTSEALAPLCAPSLDFHRYMTCMIALSFCSSFVFLCSVNSLLISHEVILSLYRCLSNLALSCHCMRYCTSSGHEILLPHSL